MNSQFSIPWQTDTLANVAPAESGRIRMPLPDPCWLLNLDQIEKETGYLGEREYVSPESASNSTHVFTTDHVLYSKLRPNLNKVVCPDETGLCTTELVRLKPDPHRLNRKFLTYFLRSEHFMGFARQVVAGAKMPRMVMDRFWEFEIPLPPLAEQDRIVEILDQANALRQQRRQAVALSQRILPALFHEMFGNESFPVMTLDDVSDGKNGVKCGPFGTQLSKSEFLESGVPLWGIKHVNKGFSFPTLEFISEEKADELSAYLLLPGDIVMTRKGTIGNAHIYPSDFVTGMMHSDLLRIRADESVATPEFLYAQLVFNTDVVSQISADSTGAIMPGINVGKLKLTQLKIPPLKLQKTFTDRMKVVTTVTPQQTTSSATFETLFQTLLHRAFDGSLTASWREGQAKELLEEIHYQA